MIVYHGATRRRAERICAEGFKPRKPSRRVWFAKGKGYATGRARAQARRAHDRMVVLTCDLDLPQLRRNLGAKRVICRSGIIAIDGLVPVTVLRTHVDDGLAPTSPDELRRWVSRLLDIPQWKGPGRNHPGIDRLSQWVCSRLRSEPKRPVQQRELVELAQQWLPEYFRGVELDPDTLALRRRFDRIHVEVELPPPPPSDPREAEAIECLDDKSPRRRVRGLALLAGISDPDLFDWCAMSLEDPSDQVRIAALRTIAHDCEDASDDLLEPFAASTDKHIRAVAIAGMCRHTGVSAARWFRRGLKDSCPMVRLETAGQLPHLDPTRHHRVFELALTDPNPKIVATASRLTEHQGYAPIQW